MSRIVTFGCSNTFGQGSPDCVTASKGDPPSRYAWPAVLGRLLNRPVLNLAIPGASNLEILHCITCTDFKPGDLVYVFWSYLDRWSIILESEIIQIGPWLVDNPKRKGVTEAWYKNFYNEHHARFMYKIIIEEAKRIISGTVNQWTFLEPGHSGVLTDIKMLSIDLDQLRERFPVGLDNVHVGTEAHRYIAAWLKERL